MALQQSCHHFQRFWRKKGTAISYHLAGLQMDHYNVNSPIVSPLPDESVTDCNKIQVVWLWASLSTHHSIFILILMENILHLSSYLRVQGHDSFWLYCFFFYNGALHLITAQINFWSLFVTWPIPMKAVGYILFIDTSGQGAPRHWLSEWSVCAFFLLLVAFFKTIWTFVPPARSTKVQHGLLFVLITNKYSRGMASFINVFKTLSLVAIVD